MQVYSNRLSFDIGHRWNLLSIYDSTLFNKEIEEVPATVNDVLLGRLRDAAGFSLPEEGNPGLMLRLTNNESMGNQARCYKLTLNAQQVWLSYDEYGNSVSNIGDVQWTITALGGLADILFTTVEDNDLLIIQGGVPYQDDDGMPIMALNLYNVATVIIRIPHCPALRNRENNICLVEKVKPRSGEDVFTFQYFSTTGPPSNPRFVTLVRTRAFVTENFCRDIMDTLPFCSVSGDFPMPLAQGIDPHEINNLLWSKAVKLTRRSRTPAPSPQPSGAGFSPPQSLSHQPNSVNSLQPSTSRGPEAPRFLPPQSASHQPNSVNSSPRPSTSRGPDAPRFPPPWTYFRRRFSSYASSDGSDPPEERTESVTSQHSNRHRSPSPILLSNTGTGNNVGSDQLGITSSTLLRGAGTGDNVSSPLDTEETPHRQRANIHRRQSPKHNNKNRRANNGRRWFRFVGDNLNPWKYVSARSILRLIISLLKGLAILLFILAMLYLILYSILPGSRRVGNSEEFGTCDQAWVGCARQIAPPVLHLSDMIDDISDASSETPPQPEPELEPEQRDACECHCDNDNLPEVDNYRLDWLNENWESFKNVVVQTWLSASTWVDDNFGLKRLFRTLDLCLDV